jgi:clan AA aspartic protease
MVRADSWRQNVWRNIIELEEENRDMGVTYVEGIVRGPSGRQESVKFLVDSGATYSLLPKAVWEGIRLEPKRKLSFALADGTAVERSVSEAFIILPQGEAHTPVILGEERDEALLGIVTLEILGLVFNPFDRTLHPMRMLLC